MKDLDPQETRTVWRTRNTSMGHVGAEARYSLQSNQNLQPSEVSEVDVKLHSTITPKPLKQQHAEYREHRPQTVGEILTFAGVGDRDVYNPSVPFTLDGMTIIAGRVEKRTDELSSVIFFTEAETDGVWLPIQGAPVLSLQDPFVTFAGDELIFGGVYVKWEAGRAKWSTDFYRGDSIFNLRKFASGPAQMKDVRLLALSDGRIAIFSRPQGEAMIERFGCIAKIGFTTVGSPGTGDGLDAVTADAIENAPLLFDHFLPDEWGGCNQLFQLKNGLIGAIGHKSWGEMIDGVHFLHYYSMAFALDPQTRKMTHTKIIASRDCFPAGLTKEPRLQDVTFTAGIVRHDNGTATLYTGLNDCQIGKLEIVDPLSEYENIDI